MNIPIHPLADVWPMMSREELALMGADISDNGQLQPVIVSRCAVNGAKAKLHVIDGRNRLAACEMVGVDPVIEEKEIPQDKIEAFIISCNSHRRHISQGQKAMALAMMNPEGNQGKKTSIPKDRGRVTVRYMTQARTVLKHLPDLAKKVLDGGESLNKAYAETQEYIADNEDESKKLERLKSEAPDIAERVADGELKVDEGLQEHKKRLDEEKADRMGWWKILRDLDTTRLVLNTESVREIVSTYKVYHKEAEVDLESLSHWLVTIFTAFLEELNEDEEDISDI